jgi:glutathione S-transferase
MTIIIHHLHISGSERIVWLCEELSIDYGLKMYNRSPLAAPPDYKALHPAGTSPIIQDGDLTLAESCACIEYICHKYSNGDLFLSPTDPSYADFLYWWHWVDGTFQPGLGRVFSFNTQDSGSPLTLIFKARLRAAFDALNGRLGDNEWLAGNRFTVADIMVVFTLTTMRYFFPYSLKDYENILSYLQRISKRVAYQKAIKKCEPTLDPVLGADPPQNTLI